MVRLTPENGGGSLEAALLAIGLFVSVSALVALCAKQASRVSRKLGTRTSDSKHAPRSSKQLLATISNKAIPFLYKKKIGENSEVSDEVKAEEEFGDGGLWQRTILMGEKCQPLDFAGVIYYDRNGKQLSELPPRSPRASPLPSFSFPVVNVGN
ncbi:hypothetical protein HHK36_015038 [Tetracentron sinense]|uniref:Uncharacterized protein n=1 Tax=Tetracentron sinense TaxID=13715 RepID=A0A834Z6F9_TETSI|nr:hypothetical protein HHK36_015038 [Tetracentron sinense]